MVRFDDLLPFPDEAEADSIVGVYGVACRLAGLLIDTFLFGIFTVQALTYAHSKIKDPLWVKCLVGAVCAMACLLTSYNWWVTSYSFVYNYGYHGVFLQVNTHEWLPLIDSVTMSLCQTFFGYRAYRLLDRNLVIPVIIGVCILGSLGSTLSIRIIYGKLNSRLDAMKIQSPTVTWMVFTMVADATITCSILFGLVRLKAEMEQTTRLVTRLMVMTLESQVSVTAVAIVVLLDSIIEPENMLGVTILTFHSKIYVLGMFYMLNSPNMKSHAYMASTNVRNPINFSHTQAATIVIEQETEMHVMKVPPPPAGISRHHPHFQNPQPKLEVEDDDKSQDDKSLGSTQYSGRALNPQAKVTYAV